MTVTKYTFCRICEATCGLEATVEPGRGQAPDRVVQLRPDRDHVVSKGYACVKGLRMHEVHHSPDRLTHPLKRVGDSFVRISWEQALQEIGDKTRALVEEHGGDATGLYLGNPISFNFFAPILAAGFVQGLGSRNLFQTGSQDCNNKFVVAQRMYGFPFVQPYPDIANTKLLILVGSNPAVSRASFVHLPDPVRQLRAIEGRGGRVIFVNPRRTETARQLGEHVFIRPDTDVFFYASFLREVLHSDRWDRGRVAQHMRGRGTLEQLVGEWTPERTAEVTGVPAETLRDLVSAYLDADGAALFCGTGVNQGTNGTLAFWLQECINAVSGNLDRRGGTLVGEGIVPGLFAKLRELGHTMRSDRSRVGDLPSCVDSFPAGIMADEILTPGPGQLRALFVLAGNPVLSVPNSGGRLEEALRSLELLVAIDIFRGETANLAHYILPGLSALQRPTIPFTFQTLMAVTPVPFMQYTDRVVPPVDEQRDEIDIMFDLAEACGADLFGSPFVRPVIRAWRALGRLPFVGDRIGWSHEGLNDLVLRATRHGSVAHFRKNPHGMLLPERVAGDFLGERVITDDGLVDLAPAEFIELFARLAPRFEVEREQRQTLRLISKREALSHNSWMHNAEHFVKGRRSTNYLYMHPEDAKARSLSEGDVVTVTSEAGAVELPVTLTDDMMTGAVALPHGWGHQKADGLSVASRTTGANVNLLSSSGPDTLEPLSGMAQLNGIAVQVCRSNV